MELPPRRLSSQFVPELPLRVSAVSIDVFNKASNAPTRKLELKCTRQNFCAVF